MIGAALRRGWDRLDAAGEGKAGRIAAAHLTEPVVEFTGLGEGEEVRLGGVDRKRYEGDGKDRAMLAGKDEELDGVFVALGA